MYLVVSGGAYGLEDAVSLAGPRLTILLCLLVPITLSLPTALMAAELTALMPVEGGFYFWVKSALGPFAGFAEAYLTILYTAVDTTIYPVLFVTYLSFVIPLGVANQMIVAVAIIWLCGLLNIMGIRLVGDTSVVLTAILIAPFLALVVVGLPRLIHWQPPMGPIIGGNSLAGLGAGLSVVIWNFGGWENLSVVAAEIEAPRRNYLRAVAIALPLVVLGDFNAYEGEKTVAIMKARFRSAHEVVHGREPEKTWPTPVNTHDNSPPGTLDYIYVSPEFRVLDAGLAFHTPSPDNPDLFPSDHLGLFAKLEW